MTTNFGYGKTQELSYSRNLRRIASDVDAIAAASADTDSFINALELYAAKLDPVAEEYASRMIQDASNRNNREWLRVGAQAGKDFNKLMTTSSTAFNVATMLSEQVNLIKTIPLNAATKAQALARDAVANSLRASDITASIQEIGGATYYEATRIARTEIAKTNAILTKERARDVGVTSYIWRSVGDTNSRQSHVKMDGKVCDYNDPPTVDGEPLNPGEIYNCRCFAEPIIT